MTFDVGHRDGIHVQGRRFWLHVFVWTQGHRRWPVYWRFRCGGLVATYLLREVA